MKQNCLRNKEFRTEIVESAQRIGICRTALLYGISRVSVAKWLKKFQTAGEDGLANRSRKHQKHPNRLTDEVLKQIIQAKTAHPEWSSLKIIRELNLAVTPATVLKKIRENIQEKSHVVKNRKIHFDTTSLSVGNGRFYKYLLSAREENSGLILIGFANENIALMQAIFADFVFKILEWLNGDSQNIVIYTGNGRYTQPGRDRGAFSRLLLDKFGLTATQKKFSTTHSRDLAVITGSMTGTTRSEILLNTTLALAEINFNATENNQRFTFIQPLETDSELKKIGTENSSECSLSDQMEMVSSDFIAIVLKQFLNDKVKISNRLSIRLLQMLVDTKFNQPLAAKAFQEIANAQLIVKDYSACRRILELFYKWQTMQSTFEKSTDSYRLNAELELADGNSSDALSCYIRALANAENESDYQQEAQICGKIGNLYKKSGSNQQALIYFNRQADIASRFNMTSEKYLAHLNLGYFYSSTGDLEQARFNYQKAYNLAELLGNSGFKVEVLSRLGAVYLYRNDLIEAEKCFLPLIELGKNNKDLVLLGESYNKLAMLAVRKHEYNKAITNSQQYYNISEKRNYSAGMAVAQRIMGISFLALEQYRKALNCFKKDLQISRSINNREFVAVAIGNIGTLFLNRNQPDKAIHAFQAEQAIAQILKNLRLEYTAVTNSGIASLRLGDYQSALIYFNEQMTLSKKSGEKLYLALAYQSRAQAYSGLHDYSKAIAAIRNAIKYFIEIKDDSHTCEARVDLAVFKSQMNQQKIRAKTLAELKIEAEKNNRLDLVKRLNELSR